MRSYTIRTFILFAALLMAVIIGLQVHWMSKIYAFHEHEFNTSVVKSVRGMYEDLENLNVSTFTSAKLHTLVERPGANTYIFKIDTIPNKDSLSYYLSNEFEDFSVFTDCKAAVYNTLLNRYQYQFYVPAAGSGASTDTVFNLPPVPKNYNYVYLFFPHRHRLYPYANGKLDCSQRVITFITGWFCSSPVLFFQTKIPGRKYKRILSRM